MPGAVGDQVHELIHAMQRLPKPERLHFSGPRYRRLYILNFIKSPSPWEAIFSDCSPLKAALLRSPKQCCGGLAAACRHGICEAVFLCTEFTEWIPDPISIPEHVWSEVSPYRFGAAQVRIQINESGKTVMMQIGEAPLVITQAGEFRKEVARQFKPPIFCEFDKFSKSITLDLKIPIVAR